MTETTAPGEGTGRKRPSYRRALPYAIAAATGIVAAYLVVVLVVFPVDPDVVTPEVPAVVGDTFEAATTKLQNAGFLAAQGESRPAKTGVAGTVVEQVPAAGTRQPVGSKVVLHTLGRGK